jgi:hypothetical protein
MRGLLFSALHFPRALRARIEVCASRNKFASKPQGFAKEEQDY